MQMLSLSGFRQNADIRCISAIHSAVRKSACLSWRRKMPGWCFKRTLRSYRESGRGRKVRWRKSKACLVFPDSAVWNPMIFQISMVLRRLVQWLCLKREKRKRMITVNFVSVPWAGRMIMVLCGKCWRDVLNTANGKVCRRWILSAICRILFLWMVEKAR